MSGTFMDGGSGSGGDGGGTFVDGGGHDHGGLAMHTGADSNYMHNQGGDGNALGNILAGSGQHQNGFLAHLLGLDHDGGAPGGHSPAAHGATSGHTSAGAIWSSSLQSLKLSDFTHGLSFTPAMGMLCLYAGLIGWLFVLYGIRHNEPLANAVIGVGPPSQGVGAYTDRRLENRMREAMPIKTATFADINNQPAKPQGFNFFNFLPPAAGPQEGAPSLRFDTAHTNGLARVTSFQPASQVDTSHPYGAPDGAQDGTPAPAQSNAEASLAPVFAGTGLSVAVPASAPIDSYQLPSYAPPGSVLSNTAAGSGNLARYSISAGQNNYGRKQKFIVNN